MSRSVFTFDKAKRNDVDWEKLLVQGYLGEMRKYLICKIVSLTHWKVGIHWTTAIVALQKLYSLIAWKFCCNWTVNIKISIILLAFIAQRTDTAVNFENWKRMMKILFLQISSLLKMLFIFLKSLKKILNLLFI
jgi:hypothetical protein